MPAHRTPRTLDGMVAERVYTVSEVNRTAKRLLEEGFGSIWLRGEVSNLTTAASGHLYFTLKDDHAEISAARFRGRISLLQSAEIENGMEVIAYGRVTVYEPRGRYQFVASLIQPAGAGALQIAFEQLKRKLEAEGLFDPQHKVLLPRTPRRIGVVTSPTGAALHDILSVLARRWPVAEVFLFASAVQGDAAPGEIVAAVRWAEAFSATGEPLDVLIVGRGGGSLEDLASFNDEAVARAVHACPIPVVSAVGHEIDFSICDFVADVRAPTPSAAAEIVSPDREELLASADRNVARGLRRLAAHLRRREDLLDASLRGYVFRLPARAVERLGQRLDLAIDRLLRGSREAWAQRARTLERLSDVLRVVDPALPLRRGYSLTTRLGDAVPLRDGAGLSAGDEIETRVLRSRIRSRVEEVNPIADD